MRTLLCLLMLAVVPVVQADTSEEGLEVQCNQWQMRVRDFDFTNGEPDQQQNVTTTIYRDNKAHSASCVVGGHKVDIEFQVVGGASMRCGVGSLVTLKIDGQLIVKKAKIHGCPVGVKEIGVSPAIDSHGGYDVEFCAYTSHMEMPRFDGCVSVTAKQLEEIPKPLDPTFPIGELIKRVRFPS